MKESDQPSNGHEHGEISPKAFWTTLEQEARKIVDFMKKTVRENSEGKKGFFKLSIPGWKLKIETAVDSANDVLRLTFQHGDAESRYFLREQKAFRDEEEISAFNWQHINLLRIWYGYLSQFQRESANARPQIGDILQQVEMPTGSEYEPPQIL